MLIGKNLEWSTKIGICRTLYDAIFIGQYQTSNGIAHVTILVKSPKFEYKMVGVLPIRIVYYPYWQYTDSILSVLVYCQYG